MSETKPDIDADARADEYSRESDLAWVSDALESRREEILGRWLDVTTSQPFHNGRRGHAVADHIPALLSALLDLMRRTSPRSVSTGAPLEDDAIRKAASGHALMRMEQGLQPADVMVEFRTLRQEIGRALRLTVADTAPVSDVVGAELLLNDALDGASAIALQALSEQVERLREEFLATTIHEIRQPITSLTIYAQMAQRLLSKPEPDLERVREIQNDILQAANQMKSLITTLMDESQTALRGLVLQRDQTSLLDILREAIEQLDPDATGRVVMKVSHNLDTTLSCDQRRLTQVVVNLLSNAIKYSPTYTPVIVGITGNADDLHLTVQDRGIGIPADDLPRLFGRYARASNAVESHNEGLGLGLYLCHGIVEAHGGRIWAESAGPSRGTTMHVVLPRR